MRQNKTNSKTKPIQCDETKPIPKQKSKSRKSDGMKFSISTSQSPMESINAGRQAWMDGWTDGRTDISKKRADWPAGWHHKLKKDKFFLDKQSTFFGRSSAKNTTRTYRDVK
jgi:hypothetical protein